MTTSTPLVKAALAGWLLALVPGAPSVADEAVQPETYASAPAPVFQPAPVAQPEALELYMGQARVIDAGEVRRIVIGNGKVIQAVALDDGQVLVLPEGSGQSTLHLWSRNGTQRHFVVNVVAADTARLLSEVRAMLGPAGDTSVRVVGDKIVVDGSVASDEHAARLGEVAKRYPQVVSLVNRVGTQPMIAMDVRMVEIRRDVLESLGVRWSPNAAGPSFGVVADLNRSTALRPGGVLEGAGGIEVRARAAPFAAALGIATSITSMINLLAQNGDAVVLASPTLSCRSGGSARFVAGGELPIPYSTGVGATSVVFKEYGVKFDVSPVATESGVIAAKIATEISAVNMDVTVKEVPGLTKRRAETEVNLREHETLVIAGLLNEESSRSIDRVPALGDLPVIGNLFRSRAFRDRQTELAVFVTPRFVDPPRAAPPARQPGGANTVAPEAIDERAQRARARIRMLD